MRRNRKSRNPSRRGTTILELLVAIGVIGILTSLLLPAVQQARETARRAQCINNVKQICLASQNFESLHGYLPGADGSPLTDLLPHIEQSNVHLDPKKPTEHVVLPVVLCPSSDVLSEDLAPVHYAQNHGNDLSGNNGLANWARDKPLRARDVTDGLSATAFFAEKPQAFILEPGSEEAFEASCRRDPIRCIWHLSGSYATDAPEAFASACRDSSKRTGLFPPAPVGHHSLFINPQASYGHFIPPNTPGGFFEDPSYPILHTYTAWSRHPGGVNVALCDGSVRFVSESIAVTTWQALGSRNGSEHVAEF